jgi:hypothetical protein
VIIDQLKGKSLFISTPTYNCTLSSNYAMSLLQLTSLCRAYEVPCTVNLLHDSLVTRVRNRQADMFLASEYTHHMLIDSDIEFTAADVLKMLMMDKPFIAAPYPKKQINWRRIKDVVLKNPDFDHAHLDKMVGDYVINLVKVPDQGNTLLQVMELNSITDTGTGFMLLAREVYEKLIATGEAKSYVPMQDEPSFYGPEIYDFFRADVDEETRNYLSEDYWICRKWKKVGGDVWLAPWIQLTHWGLYAYRGNLLAIAETGVQM